MKAKIRKAIRNPKKFLIDFFKNRKIRIYTRQIDQYYADKFDELPIDANLVLLDSFWGRKIGCNPYALYRAMRSDPKFEGYRYVWVRNEGVDVPEDVAADRSVTFVRYATRAHARALIQAGILVSNSNLPPYFNKRTGQILLSTWHGVPLKTLGRDASTKLVDSANTQRNFNLSDHIVMAGAYATEKTVCSYGADLALGRVREVGSPRIDLTLGARPAAIRERLGIHDDRKIILYAPTWRGEVGKVSAQIDWQIEALRILQRRFGESHIILVSLHHLTIRALKIQKTTFHQAPKNIDINEILAAVDLLISDYSSIIFDYLVLDRPIVLFTPDLAEYKGVRGLLVDLHELPVLIAGNFDELVRSVEREAKPSVVGGLDHCLKKYLPFEDGRAAQRVIDALAFDRQSSPYVFKREKRKILIYAGSFITNGITKSVINLLELIEYDRYDVYIIVDGALIDREQERKYNLREINKKCTIVSRASRINVPQEHRALYEKFCNTSNDTTEEERNIIQAIFKNEVHRCLGDYTFYAAIDFSGYGPFWAMFIGSANAEIKLIYMHSDMVEESLNPKRKNNLKRVFDAYENYDYLVSVTDEVRNVNRKKLEERRIGFSKFIYARNVVCVPKILTKAQEWLEITNPHLALIKMQDKLFKFVCVGRLSAEKNQARLLRAFALTLDAGIDATLILVGHGPEKANLIRLARDLGVFERTIFSGLLANPYPVIGMSDCLVLPSDYEGQGLVLLEAMTLGVPCIGVDSPGVRSVLTHEYGVICEPDHACLANAMIKIAKSGFRPSKFDAAGYARQCYDEFLQALGLGQKKE